MGVAGEDFLVRFSGAHRTGGAELVRIRMLEEASGELAPEAFAELLWSVWRSGDLGERQAVLRALPGLRDPARHLPIAAEGARTNALAIFEAIAADNPYPSRFFGERELSQLVVKALFLGVPVARIVGLERRMNTELTRMAAAFVSERRAANRDVSEDAIALSRGELPRRRRW
jgi:hypothetical protein